MKAVVLHAYGGPEQLKYEETETPKYGDDEVLVKMHATSINPIDYKLRSGSAPSLAVTFPAKLSKPDATSPAFPKGCASWPSPTQPTPNS
jgi:NADPH:quinone reductase-like Zn-dependent oxidoreductase